MKEPVAPIINRVRQALPLIALIILLPAMRYCSLVLSIKDEEDSNNPLWPLSAHYSNTMTAKQRKVETAQDLAEFPGQMADPCHLVYLQ